MSKEDLNNSFAEHVTRLFIVALDDEVPHTKFMHLSTKYSCVSALTLCLLIALSVPLVSIQFLALSFVATILAASASVIYAVVRVKTLKEFNSALVFSDKSISRVGGFGRFFWAVMSSVILLFAAAAAQNNHLLGDGQGAISVLFLIVTFMNISSISYGVSVLALSLVSKFKSGE